MLTPHQMLNIRNDLANYWSSGFFDAGLVQSWNMGDRFELPTPEADVAPAEGLDLLRHRLVGAASEADLYLADREFVETCELGASQTPGAVVESNDLLTRPGLLLAESHFGVWDASNDSDPAGDSPATVRVKGLLWTPCTRTSGDPALFVVLLSDLCNLADLREQAGQNDLAHSIRQMGEVGYHSESMVALDAPTMVEGQPIELVMLMALALLPLPEITVTEAPLPRQARWRYEREGTKPPVVYTVGVRDDE